MPVLAALVPRGPARVRIEGVEQQDALEWIAWHDEPRHTVEIAARLILGVSAAWRQRLEVTSGATRMARAATRVARARRRQDRLHPGFERVVIEPRTRGCGRRWRGRFRADPRRERLPFGITLRVPVLAALVPRRAAGFGSQRIEQE